MEANNAKYAVVRYLNKLGFVVLEIDNKFYQVKSFEEASAGSWKHSFEGKDIDDVVENFLHVNELDSSQRNAITQKLEGIQTSKKYFHKDYKFILHLS